MPPKEKVIIFSAPSGAGKTTLTHHAITSFPQLTFSISATTRPPRAKEDKNTAYYYFTKQEFEKKIQQGHFLEWEEVYKGYLYGTLKAEVKRIWDNNQCAVFDVDVKGGITLKKIFGQNALSFFIMPPSLNELENRLLKRQTENTDSIRLRMQKAYKEIDDFYKFDQIILNENLELAKMHTRLLIERFIK